MRDSGIFEIEDAISVIRAAQNRADRLRIPQALIIRGGELAITSAANTSTPLEICWPKLRAGGITNERD